MDNTKKMDNTKNDEKNTEENENENKNTAANSEITENLGEAVKGDKEAAKQVATQAKDKAGQAVGLAYEKVSEQASSKINEQKTTIALGLTSLADNLREVDKNIQNKDQDIPLASIAGKYSGSLAGQIEQLADYLDTSEVSEMLGDVEDFARRNPAVFIGGAFAAGLLLARFLKSSGKTRNDSMTNNSKNNQKQSKKNNDRQLSDNKSNNKS